MIKLTQNKFIKLSHTPIGSHNWSIYEIKGWPRDAQEGFQGADGYHVRASKDAGTLAAELMLLDFVDEEDVMK